MPKCWACDGTEGVFHGVVHEDSGVCTERLRARLKAAEAAAAAGVLDCCAKQKALAEVERLRAFNVRLGLVVDAVWDLLMDRNGRGEQPSVCEQKLRNALEALDTRHHAPACPANHYHAMRRPTGPCTCGAAEMLENSAKG